MKKTIAIILSLALAAAVLSGCGAYRGMGRQETIPTTPELVPDPLPEMEPDPEDGYVNDRDGWIEDEDTDPDRPMVTPAPNAQSTPMPSATPGAQPSAQPGVQPSAKP